MLDICYLMVYVEENRSKERTSWPIRQTAVFHRFVPNVEGTFWIFLHPMPSSVLQRRLEASIENISSSPYPRNDMIFHSLAISSYINSYRWYLKALSEEFEEIVSVRNENQHFALPLSRSN